MKEYVDINGIAINEGDWLVAVQNDALENYWRYHGSADNHPEEFVRIIREAIPVKVVAFDSTPLSLFGTLCSTRNHYACE